MSRSKKIILCIFVIGVILSGTLCVSAETVTINEGTFSYPTSCQVYYYVEGADSNFVLSQTGTTVVNNGEAGFTIRISFIGGSTLEDNNHLLVCECNIYLAGINDQIQNSYEFDVVSDSFARMRGISGYRYSDQYHTRSSTAECTYVNTRTQHFVAPTEQGGTGYFHLLLNGWVESAGTGYIQFTIKNLQIIQNQNPVAGQEYERQQATEAGQEALQDTEEALSQIPVNPSDVVSSFANLISSCSYSGYDCVLGLPDIYLPAIDGVMERTDLVSLGSVNFKTYIDMIPASVMTIIQDIFTIALIIFCVKELYNLVKYVLTLKGGGDGSE